MKKFIIITLFPEICAPVLSSSMLWKAQKEKLTEFELVNLREFGLGARRRVDDTPFGGGDGMLLMIEPLLKALKFAKEKLPRAKVLLMSPSREVWSQQKARKFAESSDDYILICGHYEGFDARIENFIDEKISVGKYVLTGGELPALTIIDSVVRLIPGVLGGEKSAEIESYTGGANLEFPQFTRPEIFDAQDYAKILTKKVDAKMRAPEILLSGNHAEIAKWRARNSE